MTSGMERKNIKGKNYNNVHGNDDDSAFFTWQLIISFLEFPLEF